MKSDNNDGEDAMDDDDMVTIMMVMTDYGNR